MSPQRAATPERVLLHAGAVAVGDRGLLIRGASGAGKSALALQMMALGADLVSDDRVWLCRQDDTLVASAPDTIAGLIEARGLGLLHVPHVGQARIVAIVDLDVTETTRLPECRTCDILGCPVPCLHKVDGPHFPAALLLYLRYDARLDP